MADECKVDTKKGPIMIVEFPRGQKRATKYMGAAHGLMGVIHDMIMSCLIAEDLQKDEELIKMI